MFLHGLLNTAVSTADVFAVDEETKIFMSDEYVVGK
jgi:hypothetical protein